MSWINARRRRPVAGYAALLLGLVVVALLYGSLTRRAAASRRRRHRPRRSRTSRRARNLFDANCSSCHGLDAQGTSQAPEPGRRRRGRRLLPDVHRPHAGQGGRRGEQPRASKVHRAADLRDRRLCRLPGRRPRDSHRRAGDPPRERTPRSARSCSMPTAPSATASPGRAARSPTARPRAPLTQATPTQIYTAMLTGPEAMPVFSDGALSPQAKRDIIAYITADAGRAQPRRLLARPGRARHRGPGDLVRRPGLPGAHRAVDYRQAA